MVEGFLCFSSWGAYTLSMRPIMFPLQQFPCCITSCLLRDVSRLKRYSQSACSEKVGSGPIRRLGYGRLPGSAIRHRVSPASSCVCMYATDRRADFITWGGREEWGSENECAPDPVYAVCASGVRLSPCSRAMQPLR